MIRAGVLNGSTLSLCSEKTPSKLPSLIMGTANRERKPNALALPLQAVSHEGEQTTVYAVSSSNKIEDRLITLGLQTATDAEILIRSGMYDGFLGTPRPLRLSMKLTEIHATDARRALLRP